MPRKDFPGGRLRRRIVYSVEGTLASLPMVLMLPIIAAVAGTAWAISRPSLTIRNGLVVGEQSFGSALLNGVLGGIVGLAAVIALVSAVTYALYCLRGDRIWEAGYGGRYQKVMFWELRCRQGIVPADPSHLGTVECWVKTPAGNVARYSGELVRRHDPNGLVARMSLDHEPGSYEVRWYAAREGEGLREVTRDHRRINGVDDPEPPWTQLKASVSSRLPDG